MPKQVSLRLPDDLHSAVAARMRATGATRTSVITEALRSSLMDSGADTELEQLKRDVARLKEMANL